MKKRGITITSKIQHPSSQRTELPKNLNKEKRISKKESKKQRKNKEHKKSVTFRLQVKEFTSCPVVKH